MDVPTCAPIINLNDEKIPTCYSKEDLIFIAKQYNKNNKNDKINLKLSKEKLWLQLKLKNKDNCKNNEYCWIKNNFKNINNTYTKSKLNNIKQKFRPLKPSSWKKNPNDWLDTFNILFVMKQYESKYNNFKFIGVFPIDFMTKIGNTCISDIMCNLNILELYNKGIYKLGIVLNLDKSWQSGSHWTSIAINTNPSSVNFGFYYYDSAAPLLKNIPKEVKELFDILKKQITISKKNNINNKLIKNSDKFEFKFNIIKHQYKTSECGMFGIYFLDKFIKNVNIEKIVNDSKLNDQLVENNRNKFFTSDN
jgi:hypothetical protein